MNKIQKEHVHPPRNIKYLTSYDLRDILEGGRVIKDGKKPNFLKGLPCIIMLTAMLLLVCDTMTMTKCCYCKNKYIFTVVKTILEFREEHTVEILYLPREVSGIIKLLFP